MQEVVSIKIVHSVEVPVTYDLYQDEWSLASKTFGLEDQLKVIGYNGEPNPRRYYILECSVCSLDPELFGDGYFRSKKGNLLQGNIPCGCAHNPNWSVRQYEGKAIRKAGELGYNFLSFYGDWKNRYTRLSLACDLHGNWNTTTFNNFFHHEEACPECGKESTTQIRRFSNEKMAQMCLSSGLFHPDTEFYRNTEVGFAAGPDWKVYCPECDTVAHSFMSNLVKGHRPCICTPMRQKEAYINLVMDKDRNIICIKLGIAVDSERRAKEQNKASKYTIQNYLTFVFPDVESTKLAERVCKRTLECGVVDRDLMADGFTETTTIGNIGKIIEIYENHGGILITKDKSNDTTS